MSIGAFAAKTGLSASAVRYYEAEGLLRPVRRVGGQRRFDEGDLARAALIRLGQAAGFRIKDIRLLVEAAETPDAYHEQMQTLAEEKLQMVRAQRHELAAMEKLLEAFQSCQCPTLEACLRQARRRGFGHS